MLSPHAFSLHRFLVRATLAGTQIFAWFIIFQHFTYISASFAEAIARTLFLFILAQMVTILATPAAALLLRGGVRRMMTGGLLALSFGYVALATGVTAGISVETAVIVFAFAVGMYRALYFIPYAVERAMHESTRPSKAAEVAIALMPFAAGLCIAAFSTDGALAVLAIGASVFIASLVPLIGIAVPRERFAWSYRATFAELVAPSNRKLVVRALARGAVGGALLLIWPMAAFFVLNFSYGIVGLVFSLTLLAGMLLRRPALSLTERMGVSRGRVVRRLLVLSPWIVRMAIATPLGVVVADAYGYVFEAGRAGIDVASREQAADGGSYVDEFTALKEISLALGRAAIAGVCVMATLLVSPAVGFLSALFIAGMISAMRPAR